MSQTNSPVVDDSFDLDELSSQDIHHLFDLDLFEDNLGKPSRETITHQTVNSPSSVTANTFKDTIQKFSPMDLFTDASASDSTEFTNLPTPSPPTYDTSLDWATHNRETPQDALLTDAELDQLADLPFFPDLPLATDNARVDEKTPKSELGVKSCFSGQANNDQAFTSLLSDFLNGPVGAQSAPNSRSLPSRPASPQQASSLPDLVPTLIGTEPASLSRSSRRYFSPGPSSSRHRQPHLRHSYTSGINPLRRGKPLPEITVQDPNDPVAVKRARNTQAARISRQKRFERYNEMAARIAKLGEENAQLVRERNFWMAQAERLGYRQN